LAIYSCNVASIGRTTHAAGTAGAHLSYIGRETAEPVILAEHMPADPAEARTWMDRQEREERANARLGTKVRLALPRELSADERAELVRDFAAEIGQGRVPWFAGIHQTGDDKHNPHAHLFIRDKDVETGKRLLRITDSPRDRAKAGLVPNGVDWLRERWEHTCNHALERAGHDVRIDRRSLAAQGIDREATIHIGPRAQHIEKNVQRPESQPRDIRHGPRRGMRWNEKLRMDYPMIDAGRTRLERNAEIIDLNLERAARSPDFETRERAKWERDQRARDRALERELATGARRRTLERRRVRGECRRELDIIRAQEGSERRLALEHIRKAKAPALAALRVRHRNERDALKAKESGILRRLMVAIDFTGATRRKRDAAKSALASLHKRERTAAAKDYRDTRTTHLAAVTARYSPVRQELIERRDTRLSALQERHRAAEQEADRRRQAREAEREQARARLDMTFRIIRSAGGRERNAGAITRQRDRDGPSLG
jgi:hypothetical protein